MTERAGWSQLERATHIELQGDDRATFLHNFCTNNIRELPPGKGCEAFVLNAQGKIVAHVLVFAEARSLVLRTVAGQGGRLIQHLERYLIREKVALHDRSEQWAEILLAGPMTDGWLRAHGMTSPPDGPLDGCETELWSHSFALHRAPFAGPSAILVRGEAAGIEALAAGLRAEGVSECGPDAVEALRIECGFPAFGRDISEKNLPQEIARDPLAISFTKGCYLGQETVARIDALGHVNWLLCGVRFDGSAVPCVGCELTSNGSVVGHVTSATFSPRLNAPLALALVRRGWHEENTSLISSFGKAAVVRLPLAQM